MPLHRSVAFVKPYLTVLAGEPLGSTRNGLADEDLPDDDEEFAAPPPDETNVALRPWQHHGSGVLS